MSMPLVSCIMPTKNRPEFVPQAIAYFLRQTYPNKELVIVDDGDSVLDIVVPFQKYSKAVNVHYWGRPAFATLGEKRNWCVDACRGDLIAHWDDDDWYGPERLALQVAAMQNADAEVCGVDAPIFLDVATGAAYQYQYRGQGGYLYSATLMYTRAYWARSPFPDLQVGASTPFVCGSGRLDKAAFTRHDNWYTGIGHAGNNSPKPFKASEFTRWEGDMEARLGADWPFYESIRESMGVAA